MRLLTRARTAVLGVAVVGATILGTTAPANAFVADPGHTGITLDTTLVFAGNQLTITAVGTFNGGLIANTTVALQISGTETDGNQVIPIAATPVSISLSNTNTVTKTFDLQPGSIVSVSYTAEVTGLAPTPFSGSCAGSGVRLSDGTNTAVKTC
jgi:hypothetical protein